MRCRRLEPRPLRACARRLEHSLLRVGLLRLRSNGHCRKLVACPLHRATIVLEDHVWMPWRSMPTYPGAGLSKELMLLCSKHGCRQHEVGAGVTLSLDPDVTRASLPAAGLAAEPLSTDGLRLLCNSP